MEALTALVAGLLGRLQGLTAQAVCPGGWPWAVTLLGVGVGLLPVAGAVVVAVWRRRIGSHYGPLAKVVLIGTGVLTAGVLPLAVFRATGKVFAGAAADEKVVGLTARQLRNMDTAVCLVGPQSRYLGAGQVVDTLTAGGGVRAGLAVVGLVALPVVAALLTAISARLATRRGPGWPTRAFWLPVLAVAALVGETPPGSTAHLWFGAAAGALCGIPLVAMVRPPDRSVLARSAAAQRPAAPAGRAAPVRRAAGGGWRDRLAARFAGRDPQPPVRSAAPYPVGGPSRAGVGGSGGGAPGTGGRWAAGSRPGAVPGGAPAGRPPRPGSGGAGPRGTAVMGIGPVSAGGRGSARFQLLRPLGAGGFGSVWLAVDTRRGEHVALKAALVRDTDTEERIRREATALHTVRHPHCVRIHELVRADSDPGLAELGGMVIVMEYVPGESLGALVRQRGPMDDVAAARAWSSIAGALDAAHGCGVLHRDVKPANIVVDDARGQARLIDFGIARRTGDSTITAAGMVLGTPDFLAPEVAEGKPATPQSDAWQLAATIGFAQSGYPPRGEFPDAVSALRAAALGRPPTHLPSRSAHLALLHEALDPQPARRPSLREVQRRLDAWLAAAGTVVDGPVTTARPAR